MFMKRKLLAILLCVAMVSVMLAGCGGSDAAETGTPAEEPAKEVAAEEEPAEEAAAEAATEESYVVYLITMDQTDQHWVNVDKGAQKAADELGNIEYQWLAPDVKDDAKQIECINNAVAGGADVIMLAANGANAVTAALEEADAAGVKIVYVDSPADYPAVQTLATDNKAAGKTAGEEMIKALEAAGVTEGTIGIIGVMTATASTMAREEGFREAFDGKAYELLETQYGEGDVAKSKDFAANFITQGVVGLFGTNEGSTVGVGNAIQESGDEIIGVGFDKSDAILQLIKDGYVLCAMSQNPDVMGYEGMKTAYNALTGGEIGEDVIDTGVSVINKEGL